MKNYLNIIIITFLVVGYVSTNAHAEAYGPNIKGFQLGMSYSDVDKLAEKLGVVCVYPYGHFNLWVDPRDGVVIDVTGFNTDNVKHSMIGKAFPRSQVEPKVSLRNEKGDIAVLYYNAEKDVQSYLISSNGIDFLFNAVGTRKGFLQAFINNYKIPKMSAYGRNIGDSQVIEYYEYKNGPEGFKIVCNVKIDSEVESIEVDSIPKETSNFNFK